MKRIGIFLDEIKDQSIDIGEKFEKTAQNTGNMLFWHSLKQTLDLDVKSRWYLDNPDQLNLDDYKAFVTTDLIWILEMEDYSYINNVLDIIGDLPLIPISIGLQANDFDPNFKLHSETVKVLKRISERCVMGVRGYYTAEILTKYGISNFEVIGCPSMYMPGVDFTRLNNTPKKLENITVNFETFYDVTDMHKTDFLKYCANRDLSFAEQTPTKPSKESIPDGETLSKIRSWLGARKNCFFDIEDWRKYMRGFDFSMGLRFHGNVMALWENVPALFLTCDSRTRELCELYSLPSIGIDDFDPSKPIEHYYELADYKRFKENYSDNLEKWNVFLKMNSLTNDTACQNSADINRKGIFMENKIKLVETEKNRNKVIFHFEASGDFSKYLRTDREFFIEYSFSVQQIPNSVLNVAFVCNVLPLVWILDGELYVDELDADFIDCIEQIKEGYEIMYPNIDIKGSINIKESVKIQSNADPAKSLLFFSGGVDATSVLIKVLREKPILMSLWGTDIFLRDVDGWNTLDKQNQSVADSFGLPYITVKSSFRSIFFYDELNKDIAKPNNENRWHGFQHGIALLSHAAPIAFYHHIGRVYFSATYSAKSSEDEVCASSPIIDNYVKFCECRCIHECFEDSRYNKVKAICDYSVKHKHPIKLHVCWETRTGNNCCKCEKCIRTMLEILAAGYDPADYGFNVNEETYSEIVGMIDENKIAIAMTFWGDSINKLYYNKRLQENNVLVKYLVERYGGRFGEAYKRKTIPTVFNVGKELTDDYSIGEGIGDRPLIFRNKPNNSTFERAVESFGRNTGNMVFLESIKKNLGAYEIPFQEYIQRQDEFKANPVITTDLIWITENGNFDYLIQQLESMKYQSQIPMGVGIQASLTNRDFKLNSSVKRVLEMLQERNTLGVRGEFTADILQKNGIKNLNIIGCPSMYYWGDPNFRFDPEKKQPKKVAANFRTIYGVLNKFEKHFLSYCADRKYSFVEQTLQTFKPENANDTKYYNYVSKWLNRNTNVFFDTESWGNFISGFDFSIGYRFHGNVLALWNNVRALFIITDARTEEMLRYFNLPFIYSDKFDNTKPIEYYYELADYDGFNKSYCSKYDNFSSFIKASGLKAWGRADIYAKSLQPRLLTK